MAVVRLQGKRGKRITCLFGAVQKGIANIPAQAIGDDKPPGQGRLIEIGEEADCQVTQEDVLMVEARAGEAEEGG